MIQIALKENIGVGPEILTQVMVAISKLRGELWVSRQISQEKHEQVFSLTRLFERAGKAISDFNQLNLDLIVANGRLKAALEKISKIDQCRPDLGQIIGSEHYEAAWLDCLEIAKQALTAQEKVG